MGRSRFRFGESAFPHFLTCTVVGWLPVFTRPETVPVRKTMPNVADAIPVRSALVHAQRRSSRRLTLRVSAQPLAEALRVLVLRVPGHRDAER